MDRPRRKHLDILTELMPLAGRRVVDIGCGDGALVRALAKRGAQALGLDPGLAVLRKAVSHAGGAASAFIAARAESLPLVAGAADLVIFFNSLHHVPVAGQAPALTEARRVLAPGGQLYIMEPLAEGAYFELVRPVEDETEVRSAAYRAIRDAVDDGRFEDIAERVYEAPVKHADYTTFRQRILDVDPARAPAVAALEQHLRTGFAAAGEPVEDGVRFWQPSRANLLRRPGP